MHAGLALFKPDGDAREGLFDARLIRGALGQDVGVGAVGHIPSVSIETKGRSSRAEHAWLIVGASGLRDQDHRHIRDNGIGPQ